MAATKNKTTQKKEEQKNMEKNEYLVFDCAVIRAYEGNTKYDKDTANRLTVFSEDMPYTSIWAYDECGSKFTPTWLKDAEGYMNLKSTFDIPVMNADGNIFSFKSWSESGCATGAEIKLKIKQKEGAIYPVAIKVIKDGEGSDPFEDM